MHKPFAIMREIDKTSPLLMKACASGEHFSGAEVELVENGRTMRYTFVLALTPEYGSEARKALSWRIAVDSFVLLVGSYFVGTYILAFFGISLPVVQVGGGMVLVAMGWVTLMENDKGCDKSARESIERQDAFQARSTL
jgi:MarC family integral membrane protein/Type VI secretion system effector, Hcp